MRLKYIDSLDTLRAVSVLFVMMLHASYGFFIGGWVGVDLFFVISGYLISSILLREYNTFQDISFKNFYIRRALKLFPPLIITLILANILWGKETLATLGGLFYFTNVINTPGNLSHLWSLSVEEHFYLFWPVILLILTRKRNPFILLVILIIVVSVIKILYTFTDPIYKGAFIIDSRFTLFKIDGLLMGALIAFMKPVKVKAGWIFLLMAGFLFVFLKVDSRWLNYQKFGFILVNLLCFGIVLTAVNYSGHWVFSSNILKWIGKRSYGLYLYHFPIFIAMEDFKHPHDKVNFAIVFIGRFALSFILAAISYYYLEEPILRLKHRFQPDIKKAAIIAA